MESNGDIIIRKARREDCKAIMDLKIELAVHQDMGHLPMLSIEELQRDGFDVNPPCYHCLVAEISDNDSHSPSSPGNETAKLGGYALYFYAFAAWEGKALHLEDLCVSKSIRGKGIGTKLLKELAKIALEEKCSRIQLEVLDENESGRKFYDRYGGWNTTGDEGWHNFRLDAVAIHRLASKPMDSVP